MLCARKGELGHGAASSPRGVLPTLTTGAGAGHPCSWSSFQLASPSPEVPPQGMGTEDRHPLAAHTASCRSCSRQ